MDLERLYFSQKETSRRAPCDKISQHHLRDSLAKEKIEPEFLSVYRWRQAFRQQNPD